MSAHDSARDELIAITVRRAERADRYMAALGACAATAGVYAAVAEAFWLLGLEGEAREYSARARACEALCTERNPPTTPVAARKRLPNRPPTADSEARTAVMRKSRAA